MKCCLKRSDQKDEKKRKRQIILLKECATQITTLTPTGPVEDNDDVTTDSSLPITNKEILLVEEIGLLPVSNDFDYYPYDYPTTTQHVAQPQIISRALQVKLSYH